MSGSEFGKCANTQCVNHAVSYNVPLRRVVAGGVFKSQNDTDSATTFPLALWVCSSCYKEITEPKFKDF
jgi:hypothetical protein